MDCDSFLSGFDRSLGEYGSFLITLDVELPHYVGRLSRQIKLSGGTLCLVNEGVKRKSVANVFLTRKVDGAVVI